MPRGKPRTRRIPRRGSVSTAIPPGWVSLDHLVAEAGVGKIELNNLRQRYRYMIPRPLAVPLANRRGGTAYYHPKTGAIIRRWRELRRTIHSADDCLWRLWLEGHPIEMRGWTAERLEPLAASVKEVYPVSGEVLRAAAPVLIRSLGRRIRNTAQVRDLTDWALSAAAGEPGAAADIEEDDPPIFNTLRKVGGLPPSYRPPERPLVEMLDLDGLAGIVAGATDEEAEQARRDWQIIARLAAAVENVDWNLVLPIVEPAISKVTGAPRDPPSWRKRKAQRTRPQGPPAIVKLLLQLWRNFDFRAMALAFLIGARRDPERSKRITEIHVLAEWALSLFPRRNAEPKEDGVP